MSGPLRNTKREAFAQAVFQRPHTGLTLAECYAQSGFKARGHSADELGSRLAQTPEVRNRITELQAAVARKAVITVESICAELDEAVQVAREKGQAAAMVSASTLRAKLAGLLRDKIEISNQDPFSQCQSMTEVADQLLRNANPDVQNTERKRQRVLAELTRFKTAIAAIAADHEEHDPQGACSDTRLRHGFSS